MLIDTSGSTSQSSKGSICWLGMVLASTSKKRSVKAWGRDGDKRILAAVESRIIFFDEGAELEEFGLALGMFALLAWDLLRGTMMDGLWVGGGNGVGHSSNTGRKYDVPGNILVRSMWCTKFRCLRWLSFLFAGKTEPHSVQ
jgi:hypothetical protein